MDREKFKSNPAYRDGYIAAIIDAAQVIICLPFDKDYLEIAGQLSETDSQALAWRIAQKVIQLREDVSCKASS